MLSFLCFNVVSHRDRGNLWGLHADDPLTEEPKQDSVWNTALGNGSNQFDGQYTIVPYDPDACNDPKQKFDPNSHVSVCEAAIHGQAEVVALDAGGKDRPMIAGPVNPFHVQGTVWQLLDIEPSICNGLAATTREDPADGTPQTNQVDGINKLVIFLLQGVQKRFGGLGEDREWKELFKLQKDVIKNRLTWLNENRPHDSNPTGTNPATHLTEQWSYNPTPKGTLVRLGTFQFNFSCVQELRHTVFMLHSILFPHVQLGIIDGLHRCAAKIYASVGRTPLSQDGLEPYLKDHPLGCEPEDGQIPRVIPRSAYGPNYMTNMTCSAPVTVINLYNPVTSHSQAFDTEALDLIYSFSQNTQTKSERVQPTGFPEFASSLIEQGFRPLSSLTINRGTFPLTMMLGIKTPPPRVWANVAGEEVDYATCANQSEQEKEQEAKLWEGRVRLAHERSRTSKSKSLDAFLRKEDVVSVANKMRVCSVAYQDPTRRLMFQGHDTPIEVAKQVERDTGVQLYDWLIRRHHVWKQNDHKQVCQFSDGSKNAVTKLFVPGYTEKEIALLIRSVYAAVIILMFSSNNPFGKKMIGHLTTVIGPHLHISDQQEKKYAVFLRIFEHAMIDVEKQCGYPNYNTSEPSTNSMFGDKKGTKAAHVFLNVAYVIALSLISDDHVHLEATEGTARLLQTITINDRSQKPRTKETEAHKQFLNSDGHVINPFIALVPFFDQRFRLSQDLMQVSKKDPPWTGYPSSH